MPFGITSIITSDRSMGTLQLVMVTPAKAILNDGQSDKVIPYIGQEFLLGCLFFIISIGCIRYAAYLARTKGTMDLS